MFLFSVTTDENGTLGEDDLEGEADQDRRQGRIDEKIAEIMALQEVLAMVLLPNWLDVKRMPIENVTDAEEIPRVGRNRRSSGKSRIRMLRLVVEHSGQQGKHERCAGGLA